MNAAKPLERLGAARSLARKVPLFLDAIRFHETAFALPFAYTGMLLAARGLPSLGQLLWITVAMVGARTVGMSANRIIDRRLDARNPRTAGRHLPAGALRTVDIAAPAAASLAVFFVAAAMLNTLALLLAPVAVAYLAVYPYAKRRTWAANLMLGGALGMAPVGSLDRGHGKPVLAAGPAVCRRGPVGQQLRHPLPRSGLRLLPPRGTALGGVAIRDSRRLPVGPPLRRTGTGRPPHPWPVDGASSGRTSWAGPSHWRCWRTSTAWSLPATSQG